MYIKIPPGPTLAKKALILAHPLDLNLFLSLCQKPIKKISVCLAKLYIFPNFSFIGPCLGRPQLLILLEHLYSWRVKNILFFGWCGGLKQTLNIGDIISPKTTIKKRQRLSWLKPPFLKPPFSIYRGKVISVDNPYALTQEEISLHQKQNIMGIDMEIETLFRRSAELDISCAGLLIVSDLLKDLQWKSGFSLPYFKQKRTMAIKWLNKMFKCLKNL
jgi:uridine phosphorylase